MLSAGEGEVPGSDLHCDGSGVGLTTSGNHLTVSTIAEYRCTPERKTCTHPPNNT